ncbi:MAG: ABC transporter ATP-binding protein [Lentisphaeria bacterium]|nr:ABC transporter ATP-binding protein [Lentisphaeria bacterium]
MVDIKLDSITKSYGSTVVVDNTSLNIGSGELFFLLGPSGCGKTTLLRIISGLLEHDSGDLYFDGDCINDLKAEKRDAAMVFQSYALWPHMTVFKNVAYGLEVRKCTKEEIRKRVGETLEMVDLAGFADRHPGSLSGGQQQRVALARAIIVRPKVLLLDEPLSNLDARLRISMRSEIRRICKASGLTAIYVTHDQAEALTMADRIAVMNEGKIEQIGKPREIYKQPKNRFVANFIGECNFIDAVFSDGVFKTHFGEFITDSHNLDYGSKCTLAIRPESFRIGEANDKQETYTLSETRYQGAIEQFVFKKEDQELLVSESNPGIYQEGQKYSLSVEPEDIIVFDP